MFKDLGFKVNIDKNDFVYMVYGKLSQVRIKLLVHTAMTNIWKSTSGLWLRNKREWNEKNRKYGRKI